MKKGWLVYNKEDLKKNRVFAEMLIQNGANNGLEIQLIERERITLGVGAKGLYIMAEDTVEQPSFVINRTRDSFFSRQLELMAIQVFNSGQVTDLCNDKRKTHQWVNHLGIPSVHTLFYDSYYGLQTLKGLDFPVVIKTVDGHGGDEVYQLPTKEALEVFIQEHTARYFVIQALCSKVGVDIRVFVVGSEIVAAIKRESTVDFRSNYSLGGETSLYEVDESLRHYVETILKGLACDCVGIDFMVDREGNYIFNEIEDVVGSRSLYKHSDVDLAKLYIEHIKRQVSR